MMSIIHTTLAVSILLILNILVTIILLKNASFSNKQKKYQLILIWLLPLLGALLIYTFIREDNKTFIVTKTNNSRSIDNPSETESGGDGEA